MFSTNLLKYKSKSITNFVKMDFYAKNAIVWRLVGFYMKDYKIEIKMHNNYC